MDSELKVIILLVVAFITVEGVIAYDSYVTTTYQRNIDYDRGSCLQGFITHSFLIDSKTDCEYETKDCDLFRYLWLKKNINVTIEKGILHKTIIDAEGYTAPPPKKECDC